MTLCIRTATKDVNHLSLNSDSIVWDAGSDKERQHEGSLPFPLHLLPEQPKDYDAILKLSGRKETVLCGLKVAQGKECAVDLNNTTRDCTLEGRFGVTGNEGEQVIKVKGGSHHIGFKGWVESRGRDCDLVLGEWSDQSTEPVHHIDLTMLRRKDGTPLTVVLGRVNNPLRFILKGQSDDIGLPPGARILKWRSLQELTYWWLKRAYVAIWYFR